MLAAQHKITFQPNPIQKQFIESRAQADLYSSRMGEGKSTALAWSALFHTRHNPGANWALIRDTWENMRATTLKTFFDWFPPGVMGEFHKTNKEFTWASGIANGSVVFLGMDDPQDATKLMSRELAGFGMDEPAPAVGSSGIDELIFDLGLSRLRQKGMKWYSAKLAENNPDETHWTFKKFVTPGIEGFAIHQPVQPENQHNLPSSYYADLRKFWAHRPDLIRRFVDGEFGFQAEGRAVTPQWSDKVHLALGLVPLPRREVVCLWDWGLNPTCIMTQITPQGFWHVLDAVVGENKGAEELIIDEVRPLLSARYRNCPLWHIGDPNGKMREQSSSVRSAVKLMLKELGGRWTSGPVHLEERVEPLRSVLGRLLTGPGGYPRGLLQVDRDRAGAVWHALRGGWHYHVAKTGVVASEPKKDLNSHPGDAMAYGAAVLFPMGRLPGARVRVPTPREASYFGGQKGFPFKDGPATIPKHGQAFPFPKAPAGFER